MKNAQFLIPVDDTRELRKILGRECYMVFLTIYPLKLYRDPIDDTYSVRGLWDADDLTAEDLINGIFAFTNIDWEPLKDD